MADIQHDDAAREAYTKALHDGKAQTAVVEAQAADTGKRCVRDCDVFSDDHYRELHLIKLSEG